MSINNILNKIEKIIANKEKYNLSEEEIIELSSIKQDLLDLEKLVKQNSPNKKEKLAEFGLNCLRLFEVLKFLADHYI
jgi:hypothetical protein